MLIIEYLQSQHSKNDSYFHRVRWTAFAICAVCVCHRSATTSKTKQKFPLLNVAKYDAKPRLPTIE